MTMLRSIQPLHFLLTLLAGWVNRQQTEVIEYLKAKNRLLKERLGGRRLRFTDADAVDWRAERTHWGAKRSVNLGHDVSRGTTANVLSEQGIDPAPERGKRTSWSTFLKAHWDSTSSRSRSSRCAA
jgi:hypothetical protein